MAGLAPVLPGYGILHPRGDERLVALLPLRQQTGSFRAYAGVGDFGMSWHCKY